MGAWGFGRREERGKVKREKMTSWQASSDERGEMAGWLLAIRRDLFLFYFISTLY